MLKVDDLLDIQRSKRNQEKEIFETILQDCYKRIKSRNSFGGKTLEYNVPPFIMDAPLYNIDKAVRYIEKKLKKGGFKVHFKSNALNIDWAR